MSELETFSEQIKYYINEVRIELKEDINKNYKLISDLQSMIENFGNVSKNSQSTKNIKQNNTQSNESKINENHNIKIEKIQTNTNQIDESLKLIDKKLMDLKKSDNNALDQESKTKEITTSIKNYQNTTKQEISDQSNNTKQEILNSSKVITDKVETVNKLNIVIFDEIQKLTSKKVLNYDHQFETIIDKQDNFETLIFNEFLVVKNAYNFQFEDLNSKLDKITKNENRDQSVPFINFIKEQMLPRQINKDEIFEKLTSLEANISKSIILELKSEFLLINKKFQNFKINSQFSEDINQSIINYNQLYEQCNVKCNVSVKGDDLELRIKNYCNQDKLINFQFNYQEIHQTINRINDIGNFYFKNNEFVKAEIEYSKIHIISKIVQDKDLEECQLDLFKVMNNHIASLITLKKFINAMNYVLNLFALIKHLTKQQTNIYSSTQIKKVLSDNMINKFIKRMNTIVEQLKKDSKNKIQADGIKNKIDLFFGLTQNDVDKIKFDQDKQLLSSDEYQNYIRIKYELGENLYQQTLSQLQCRQVPIWENKFEKKSTIKQYVFNSYFKDQWEDPTIFENYFNYQFKLNKNKYNEYFLMNYLNPKFYQFLETVNFVFDQNEMAKATNIIQKSIFLKILYEIILNPQSASKINKHKILGKFEEQYNLYINDKYLRNYANKFLITIVPNSILQFQISEYSNLYNIYEQLDKEILTKIKKDFPKQEQQNMIYDITKDISSKNYKNVTEHFKNMYLNVRFPDPHNELIFEFFENQIKIITTGGDFIDDIDQYLQFVDLNQQLISVEYDLDREQNDIQTDNKISIITINGIKQEGRTFMDEANDHNVLNIQFKPYLIKIEIRRDKPIQIKKQENSKLIHEAQGLKTNF